MRFSTCSARLRSSAVHVAYTARSPQSMWLYGRVFAVYAAYMAGSPQSMRHILPGLRSLYYATIYPTEISKVPLRYISAQCRIADTEAYRHKLVSFSFPQSPHYIKKAQGCAEGRGLVPLCGFLTFQCDLPSAGFRSPCGIQLGTVIYAVIQPEFRNLCGIYGRNSAIHAAIRPGPPQPMRLLFPHTKFRKYLINKVFPK